MSGPEWTPEPGGPDLEGRPLTGDPAATANSNPAPTPTVRVGSNPFGAGSVRPDATEQDDAEAQANLEADTARPSKLGALVGATRTVVVSLIVGLWNKHRRRSRAEVTVPDLNAADSTLLPDPGAPTEPDAAEDGADVVIPVPAGVRGWSPAGWSWETRVGVAAVFSFLILVGVFIVKKGWLGQWKTVPLAVNSLDAPKKKDKAGKSEPVESPPPPLTAEHPGIDPAGGSSPSSPPAPTLATATQPLQIGEQTLPGPGPEHVPPASSASAALTTRPEAPAPANPTTLPILAADGAAVVATPEVVVSDTTGGPPSMPNLPPGLDLATSAPATPPEAPPVAPVAEPAAAPTVVETAPTSQPVPEPKPIAAPVEPAVIAAPNPPEAAPIVAAEPGKVDPPAPDPEPAVVASPTAPQPTKSPVLEPVPTATADQGAEATTSTRGDNWLVMPSAGKRPSGVTSSDIGSTESSNGDASPARGRSRVADGPPVRDDPGQSAGQAGLVLHTVQPGENFWTISQQYYNSHRYYKALHKANAGQVPDIKELYVGTVLRIPPPETLDRSLVSAPVLGAALDGATVSRASSAGKSGDTDTDSGVEIPPTRTTRPGYRRLRARPTEPTEAPRRPTYQSKANDTLRSVARDTLTDSHRANEIFNLNRDLLSDPKGPIPAGTTLTLPEDAVIGGRVR